MHLSGRSRDSARKAKGEIRAALLQLTINPAIGRPFAANPMLRELIIPFGDSGYVALYRHEKAQDEVIVLAFRHQREAGY